MWKEPGGMSQEELFQSGTGVRKGFCKETNDVACILAFLVQAFFSYLSSNNIWVERNQEG